MGGSGGTEQDLRRKIEEREKKISTLRVEVDALKAALEIVLRENGDGRMLSLPWLHSDASMLNDSSVTGQLWTFLNANGPAPTEVIRSRFSSVKPATIYSVLSNKRRFKRSHDGRWSAVQGG